MPGIAPSTEDLASYTKWSAAGCRVCCPDLVALQTEVAVNNQAHAAVHLLIAADLDRRMLWMNSERERIRDSVALCHTRLEHAADLEALKDAINERWLTAADTVKGLAQSESTKAAMAMAALDRRLESMNEFRGSMRDQAASMYTRAEHESFAKLIESDIRMLRESRAEMSGKANQADVNGARIMAVVGLLLGVASLLVGFFHK